MKCQVCDRPVPPGRRKNCSRACTVYAASCRYRGKPVHNPNYMKRSAKAPDKRLVRVLFEVRDLHRLADRKGRKAEAAALSVVIMWLERCRALQVGRKAVANG